MATTTVTVNVAESQNYLATSRTISVSNKQQGYITLSTNSVTLTGNVGTTQTVSITSNSGGTLSVQSSDTSKVTASLSGTTITLTSVGNGNATITVTVGETSEYTSATATISVNVQVIIPKTKVSIPSQTNTLYYNNQYHDANEAITYDNSKCKDISYSGGVNAGTYQATFRLVDTTNYEWSDGTITDKTVNWQISKIDLNGYVYIYESILQRDVMQGIPSDRVGGAVNLASTHPSLYTTSLPDFDEELGTYQTTYALSMYKDLGWRYNSVNIGTLPSVPVQIIVDMPSNQNYEAIHLEIIATVVNSSN